MSKAEKFIQENTKNYSNEYLTDSKSDGLGGYISRRNFSSWLTPDQARRAVEIAREEAIEKTAEWLTKHAIKYYFNSKGFLGTDELVEDYKLIMSMKDET